jgi:hypothetical protein
MTTLLPLIGKSRKPMHLRAKPGPKPDPSKARPRWLALIFAGGNAGGRAKNGQADKVESVIIADLNRMANPARLEDCWRLWRRDVDRLDARRRERVLAALFKRRAEVKDLRAKHLNAYATAEAPEKAAGTR